MFVLVPPEWIVKPHDLEAVEGQDVFFPCRVSGVPEPTITWKRLTGEKNENPQQISAFALLHSGVFGFLSAREKCKKFFGFLIFIKFQ